MTEYTTRIVVDSIIHECIYVSDKDGETVRNVLHGRVYCYKDECGWIIWGLNKLGNETPFHHCPYCGGALPQDVNHSLGQSMSAWLTI